MLEYRTERFSKISGTMEEILDFGAMIESRQLNNLPMADFHHCPYIGLIGPGRSCAGCLLHPLSMGAGGLDFRWLSYYGGMACHTYYCPTHLKIALPVAQLIRRSAKDWYSYGLFITETRLIDALSGELKKRVNLDGIDTDEFWRRYDPGPMDAFIRLKIDWPYRPAYKSPANYFFNDGIHAKPSVDYGESGVNLSRYDIFFQELISVFKSRNELETAEAMIEHFVDQIAETIQINLNESHYDESYG